MKSKWQMYKYVIFFFPVFQKWNENVRDVQGCEVQAKRHQKYNLCLAFAFFPEIFILATSRLLKLCK